MMWLIFAIVLLIGGMTNKVSAATLPIVSLAITPASPQPVKTSIKLTASVNVSGTVSYRFSVLNLSDPRRRWVIVRNFATINYYNWTPTVVGEYQIKADAYIRRTRQQVSRTVSFSITAITPPPLTVTLGISPNSPQQQGTELTFTGTATGGNGTIQYAFWWLDTSVTPPARQTFRAYDTLASCKYTPATAGTYTFGVTARDAGGQQTDAQTTYTITTPPPPPLTVTLGISPNSPQQLGTELTLTGAATGGSGAIQYAFWWLDTSVTPPERIIRDFQAQSSCTYTPLQAGTCTFGVTVRDAAGQETRAQTTYTITAPPPLLSVMLGISPSSPQLLGTELTLAGSATGGNGTIQYAFWWLDTSVTPPARQTFRDFDALASCKYTPATAGTFTFGVTARDAGSQVTEAQAIYIIITPPPPLLTVTLGISPDSPQLLGTELTLTGAATGGSGTIQYAFWWLDTSVTPPVKRTIRDFQTQPSCTYTPAQAGTYTFGVTARDAAGQEAEAQATYTIITSSPINVTLGVSPGGPQPLTTALTFTAAATGGNGTLQYAFWWLDASVSPPVKRVFRAPEALASCTYQPAQAMVYTFGVTAIDAAGQSADTQITYTITALQYGDPSAIEIAKFYANKDAAVSFTFDDSVARPTANIVPMLDATGLTGTFFILPGMIDTFPEPYYATWDTWREVAGKGYEIGNHSLTHQSLPDLDAAQLDAEVNQSYDRIREVIGKAPVSFAFPYNYWRQRELDVVLQRHVVARVDEPISYEGAGFTAAWANGLVDAAVQARQWIVPMIHGVGLDGPGYRPIDTEQLNQHLQYVKAHVNQVWVDTFGNVARYTIERDNAKITRLEVGDRLLRFQLDSPLDPQRFDRPLTVILHTGATGWLVNVTAMCDATGAAVPILGIQGETILLSVAPALGPITVTWDVTATPPLTVTLGISPDGPQPLGTELTLTGTATGGGGAIQYAFWWLDTSVSPPVKRVFRAPQALASCTYRPGQAMAYTLGVTASDAAGQSADAEASYTITALQYGNPSSIEIAKFHANKEAAVSFAFDDGVARPTANIVPMLDATGLTGTFFIIPGMIDTFPEPYYATWDTWREVAGKGYEIGNHSLTHLSLPDLDAAQLDAEVNQSYNRIREVIGTAPVSFAFPYNYWTRPVLDVVLQHHIVARVDEPISYEGAGFTAAWANGLVDDAVQARQWIVPMIHGVGLDGPGYRPIDTEQLNQHLQYVKAHLNQVWVDTFGNVARYVQERDAVKITRLEIGDRQVRFQLDSSLDSQRFDRPLTVILHTGATGPITNVTATCDATGAAVPILGIQGETILLSVPPAQGTITVTWEI